MKGQKTMTRTHTAPTGQKRSIGTSRPTMFINLLLGFTLCSTLLGLAFIGLTGCVYPTSGELNGEYDEDADKDYGDDIVTGQSITITGQTMMNDGTALSDSWVAIFDDITQEVLVETFSDHNGHFALSLDNQEGEYTLMAAYQDDFGSLVAWQEFSLSADSTQDHTFELTLVEPPYVDLEESDDSARWSCGYTSVRGYNYNYCWLTHRFYAYQCQPCYPYHCTWFTVGSC